MMKLRKNNTRSNLQRPGRAPRGKTWSKAAAMEEFESGANEKVGENLPRLCPKEAETIDSGARG